MAHIDSIQTIRKALPADEEATVRIIAEATAKMDADGIPQWDEIYPNRDVVKSDIAAATMYVLEDAGVEGIVTLNEFQDKEYSDLPWKYANGKQLVVHRLCVKPSSQGKGIAKALMRFAEQFAQQNGYSAIRLDCFTQNPISTGLYTNLGYTVAGVVQFRKGSFYCFEKRVD